MNRQKRLLMLLLALLALAGVYSYWALPTQQRVAGGTRPGNISAPRSSPGATGSGLKVEQLLQSTPESAGVKRDIFNFKQAPPPPPPPPPKIVNPLPPPPPPVAVQPPPVVAPSVAAGQFEFLGQLSKGDKDLWFLASGKDIYLVATGDKFGDQQQFLLKSADKDELTIEQQGLPRPIVIRLAEQDGGGSSARSAGVSYPAPRPVAVPGAPPGARPGTIVVPSQAPFEQAPPAQRFRSFKRYRP